MVEDAITKDCGLLEIERRIGMAIDMLYNDPQAVFDRAIGAMILGLKEFQPFTPDYIAITGKSSLADIVLSSQSFFCSEVEQKIEKAGIKNISLVPFGGTTDKWRNYVPHTIPEKYRVFPYVVKYKVFPNVFGGIKSYYPEWHYIEGVVLYKVIRTDL